MPTTEIDLSVVAPVFNEEPGIPEFHARVTGALIQGRAALGQSAS